MASLKRKNGAIRARATNDTITVTYRLKQGELILPAGPGTDARTFNAWCPKHGLWQQPNGTYTMRFQHGYFDGIIGPAGPAEGVRKGRVNPGGGVVVQGSVMHCVDPRAGEGALQLSNNGAHVPTANSVGNIGNRRHYDANGLVDASKDNDLPYVEGVRFVGLVESGRKEGSVYTLHVSIRGVVHVPRWWFTITELKNRQHAILGRTFMKRLSDTKELSTHLYEVANAHDGDAIEPKGIALKLIPVYFRI